MEKGNQNFDDLQQLEYTIGTAIRIMEANIVKNLGIELPILQEGSNEVSRCADAISMAFFHTMYKGGVDKQTLGCMGSIDDLVPGNVVALEPTNLNGKYFLNAINDNNYVIIGKSQGPSGSHFTRICECFLVVSAGNGRVAFYSPFNQKFVHTDVRKYLRIGYINKVCSMYDRPRMDESFTVKKANDSKAEDLSVRIFSAKDGSPEVEYNYFSDSDNTSPFYVYKVHGFV